MSLTKGSVFSIKLPYHNKGVQVEQNAVYIKLQSSVGIVVMWNRDDAVMVTVAFKAEPNTDSSNQTDCFISEFVLDDLIILCSE